MNEAKTGIYKYMFFQQYLTWKQKETVKAKRAARAAARETEIEQRVLIAQQGSTEWLFRRH